MRSGLPIVLLLPWLAGPAVAGSVDASYYSRRAHPPTIVQVEPGPQAVLPPFKVFFVRHGDCPAGEVERYVSGSPDLGVGPSRSCVSRRR